MLPTQFPSWADTPLWVKYRAVDRDGSLWWFEHRPRDTFGEWLMDEKGRLEYVGYTTIDMKDTWHGTLEDRT